MDQKTCCDLAAESPAARDASALALTKLDNKQALHSALGRSQPLAPLADSLEVALLFQPEDASVLMYQQDMSIIAGAGANVGDSELHLFSHETQPALLVLESESLAPDQLPAFVDSIVARVAKSLDLSPQRAEALLEAYSWSPEAAVRAHKADSAKVAELLCWDAPGFGNEGAAPDGLCRICGEDLLPARSAAEIASGEVEEAERCALA